MLKALIKAITFATSLVVGIVVANLFHVKEIVSVPQTLTTTTSPTESNFSQVVKIQSTERTGPSVVQSKTVRFPKSGKITVQAIEEDGRFPVMRFVSETSGKILLESEIVDSDKFLLHEKGSADSFPNLRFRTDETSGLPSPMIMSVGIYHGGSDNGYYLTVFAEIDGKLRRLNEKPFTTAIQGGFYFGELNKKFGVGLAVWGFIWGQGIDESHYSYHRYAADIYQIQGSRLVQTKHKRTKKMYSPDQNAKCLREFGIKGQDQRLGIPVIRESVEANL